MTDTIDTGWSGTPAAIASAVALYGYQVSNGYVALIDPTKQSTVLGIIPGPTLDGRAHVAVRSSATLPVPDGITIEGPQYTLAVVGGFMTDGTEKPTTLVTGEFFARFTPDETAAIWAAATTPATRAVGVGLMNGLANGIINLNSPVVAQWMSGLVQVGILTQSRHDTILTP